MDNLKPCTIGFGSNAPDREKNVRRAIDYISERLTDVKVSSIYDTPAVSGDGSTYTNAVLHGRTSMSSEQLVTLLKDYETMEGRASSHEQEGVVVIDLDLVIYDSRILRPRDFERHYFNRGYSELLANGAYVD